MNGCTIAGICLIMICIISLIKNELKKFKVVRYTIPMWRDKGAVKEGNKLKRVCRFVFVSDLHNHSFGKDNEQLLTAIDEAQPDFVVSAGDMIIAKPGKSMDTAIHFMEQLAKKYPVYYGNGNHEYRLRIYPEKYGDMYDRYKAVLDRLGVYHLENENITLQFENRKINICGLEIDRYYYKRFKKITMPEEYVAGEVGKKKNMFTILIAHNPAYFPQYAKWGADVTLSGHVHGGVVRLPKIGGVISPQFRLFPKYSGGLYQADGKYMILSCGLGTHTIPVRIGNRAELIVVDLVDIDNR